MSQLYFYTLSLSIKEVIYLGSIIRTLGAMLINLQWEEELLKTSKDFG